MTELFLLGAGASVEAGIPDAYGMTKAMLDKCTDDRRYRYQRIDKVLQFVVGGLLFQQGIRGENPYDGVNIEDLFNAVILLAERQNSELGPFISSWHPQLMGLESGKLPGSTSDDLLESIYEPIEKHLEDQFHSLAQARRTSYGSNRIDTFFSSSSFEEKFTEAVRQIMIGGEGKLFKAAAEAMILKLVEMVWITDTTKIKYLIPLVEYAIDTNSIIATLNYDNAIELTGQITGIEIDTGFDSWSNSGDFIFDGGKIPLLKLHGSIDWALSNGKTSKEKPLPFQIIEKVDPNADHSGNFRPAVVFGGKNKLTAKGPFLSLLRAFEQHLSKMETLWVIGYSFRDEHVNEFIVSWFNGDLSRVIKIISPKPDSMDSGFTRELLYGYAKDRVQIIPETTANGVSNLTKAK